MLLLAIVAGARHALGALAGQFMWDDRFLIVDAPRVLELRPLSEYFREPVLSGGRGVNS